MNDEPQPIPVFAMCGLCTNWEAMHERCSLDGSYRKAKDQCNRFEHYSSSKDGLDMIKASRVSLSDWAIILPASLMISASATEITGSLVPVLLVGGVYLGAVIAWIRFGE